jgi:hypothetical protein
MGSRGETVRPLALIVGSYAVALAAAVRWHWAGDPPYHRPTVSLCITFALVAALVGLISIWASFAAVRWSLRAAGLIVGAALLIGFATLFFEYNNFLIWQLFVLVAMCFACLITALSGVRLCGYRVARDGTHSAAQPATSTSRAHYGVRDLLVLTAALALFCFVLHYTKPTSLPLALYIILIAGGIAKSLVSLVTLWACFSRRSHIMRLAALSAVAPTGGIVYDIADNYIPLIMNAGFYAAITMLQAALMTVPLAFLRVKGYQFCRAAA